MLASINGSSSNLAVGAPTPQPRPGRGRHFGRPSTPIRIGWCAKRLRQLTNIRKSPTDMVIGPGDAALLTARARHGAQHKCL